MDALILDDGTEIEIAGTPAQGTRHTVVFGRERHSGQSVIVKIERIADALARWPAFSSPTGDVNAPVNPACVRGWTR